MNTGYFNSIREISSVSPLKVCSHKTLYECFELCFDFWVNRISMQRQTLNIFICVSKVNESVWNEMRVSRPIDDIIFRRLKICGIWVRMLRMLIFRAFLCWLKPLWWGDLISACFGSWASKCEQIFWCPLKPLQRRHLISTLIWHALRFTVLQRKEDIDTARDQRMTMNALNSSRNNQKRETFY